MHDHDGLDLDGMIASAPARRSPTPCPPCGCASAAPSGSSWRCAGRRSPTGRPTGRRWWRPCAFRRAVASAHERWSAGERLSFLGLPPGCPPTIEVGLAPGERCLPGDLYRVRMGVDWLQCSPRPCRSSGARTRPATVSGSARPTRPVRAHRVGFHRDAATDVTLVHVASPAGERGLRPGRSTPRRRARSLPGRRARRRLSDVTSGARSSLLAPASPIRLVTLRAAPPGGLRSCDSARGPSLGWSRPVMARKSAVVLVWGNGSSGTGRSRPAQSGAQPSSGRHSMRRSAGHLRPHLGVVALVGGLDAGLVVAAGAGPVEHRFRPSPPRGHALGLFRRRLSARIVEWRCATRLGGVRVESRTGASG